MCSIPRVLYPNLAASEPTSGVDINGDETVNVFDMVLVGAHFGEVIPSE